MPFIEFIKRALIEKTKNWKKVGELCFLHYLPMIRRWRKNRKWTEAHNITKDTFNLDDDQTAKLLAFLVFFVKEVMPYEDEKCKENGDIE